MLSFWTRDRVRGPQLTIEHAVRKQARDTAYMYGMYDRGTLEVGKKADLNVVDSELLSGSVFAFAPALCSRQCDC